MWNQPRSIFNSFKKDLIGKCDVCFRAGLCTRSECEAQKASENTVIETIVNTSQFHGIVDSSIMSKLVRKIMANKNVNFKKYEKIVKKQIKQAKTPHRVNLILRKMSKSLKLLSEAKNKDDFKLAIAGVKKTIQKIKASETIKKKIENITSSFQNLIKEQEKKSIFRLIFRNKT